MPIDLPAPAPAQERSTAHALETVLGVPVTGFADLTHPWARTTRTEVVTLARGEQVVIQRTGTGRAARATIARRIRLGRRLPLVAPWLPIPEVLGGDASGPEPFFLSRFVPGTLGSELLADDATAALLGRLVGELALGVARVPVRGLGLPSLWADPERLTIAARGWLAEAAGDLAPGVALCVAALVERVPAELSGERPVFAHGDMVPVNVVVRDGAIAGLLDLERARTAHPLFDAAWWRLILRYHHPERWTAAGQAFNETVGLADTDPAVGARLDLLAALGCLEMIHRERARSVVRETWTRRLEEVLRRG